jgi:nucleotide-binding universal stress UspA family protein
MDIKEILVHLDETSCSTARLQVAAELAARHGAYVIGLHVRRTTDTAAPHPNAAATSVEFQFQRWLHQQGIRGEWRVAGASVVEALALHGQFTDLILIGQHGPGKYYGDLSEREFVEVLGRAGRPVLAVPYIGSFAAVGERILVAWDGSAESTRAMHAALPLLRGAKVDVVIFGNPKRTTLHNKNNQRSEIVVHLLRHGVVAKVKFLPTDDTKIEFGDALLSYAADVSAGLMVAGAAMRSRLHGVMFGSATRTLIRRMTVPILFSR